MCRCKQEAVCPLCSWLRSCRKSFGGGTVMAKSKTMGFLSLDQRQGGTATDNIRVSNASNSFYIKRLMTDKSQSGQFLPVQTKSTTFQTKTGRATFPNAYQYQPSTLKPPGQKRRPRHLASSEHTPSNPSGHTVWRLPRVPAHVQCK